jgi:hypothetical protein
MEGMKMFDGIVIDANNKDALVFSEKIEEGDPTALYVAIMERLLNKYAFRLVGEKEALFTRDPDRAASYTGKTRELLIGGATIYLKTGFSTKSKWANVASVCKMLGVPCATDHSLSDREAHLEGQAPFPKKSLNQSQHTPKVNQPPQIPKTTRYSQTAKTKPSPQMPKANQPSEVKLSDYVGIFDPDAVFDRCYIENIGGGGSHVVTQNYIEYKGCIYFLAYKKQLGKIGTRLAGMKEPVTEDWDNNWVAFGSIDLKTFKIEILKDYRSAYWKKETGTFGRSILGEKDPVISISHDKIWYITYVRDDEDLYGADHGNLALKCLDIHTKEESVVMELSAGTSQAGMPIVMGNEFVYKADSQLHTYNFRTKKSGKRECKHIMGYNQSWIAFSSPKNTNIYTTNPVEIFLLNVTDGSVCNVRKYLQDTVGVKEKIEDLYYIDCKKKLFYVRTNKSSSLCIISENGVSKSMELPQELKFQWSFDGRFTNMAFNGSFYVTGKSKNQVDNSLPYNIRQQLLQKSISGYFVKYDLNGSWYGGKCPSMENCFSDADSFPVVPVGEECAIVQLEKGAIYLYYKKKIYKLFEFDQKTY